MTSTHALHLTPESDAQEILFWTLMRTFEVQALEHYRAHAPALATHDKIRFAARLAEIAGDRAPLLESRLARPVDVLLGSARGTDESSTLIVQGLILERLRQSIYRLIEETARVSPEARTLAHTGRMASAVVAAAASERIGERLGTAEPLYRVFTDCSHDVLASLDAIGDPVEEVFGDRFGLHFADVMGEFTADLVGACVELGMPRRKVVAHLATACMGL